ncbi:MAG TPA: hypothetical protein VK929_01660 [Longimicrobiales bacterium]|nr:hypothetical protein [Longimicrobiales bacterium]
MLAALALTFVLTGVPPGAVAGGLPEPPSVLLAQARVVHLPDPAADQQAPLLSVHPDPAGGNRPVVRVGPVLNSASLEEAARSGLPIRVRVRVELWRDRLFDQLVDSTSWSTVIVYEPLGELFFARSLPVATGARRYNSFAAARSAVEGTYTLPLRPVTPGRYYYTATLQVETLSLSDLDELERWLQGELQPAVSGQRPVPRAVGHGARRLVLRLLDLPHRRVDARSGRFQF